jgi:hypothetical protein
MEKTSWKLILQNAWRQTIEHRKKGMVEMSRKIDQKEKQKEKQQNRAISWLSKIGKWLGYSAVAFAVLSIAGPLVAINYISS